MRAEEGELCLGPDRVPGGVAAIKALAPVGNNVFVKSGFTSPALPALMGKAQLVNNPLCPLHDVS